MRNSPMHREPRILFLALCVLALAGCEPRGDATVAPAAIAAETPDNFLRYLNTQASLPAGEYEIVAATNVAGQSGSYTLDITHDDGRVEQLSGNWSASAGMNALAAGNPRHALTLARAGGVKVAMTSAVDGYLYLLRDERVVAQADNGGSGGQPLLDLALTKISSVAYANAYYTAVDPAGERATLNGFLQKNCFVAAPHCAGETVGHDAHVVFRDSKDLGYGRNMYARKNSDGSVAFVVDNYVIRLTAGSSTNYGPVNVEAAVRENREYYRGTNAIEFSPREPGAPGSEMITRFFTYTPAGQRITSADLDGRGVKHMPGMCWACHGGRLLPLEQNGDFPLLSLRSAKLNQLEADSFEYSALSGYTRAESEAGLRTINQYVHGSYSAMAGRADTDAGKWFAGFAKEIAEGRYGGAGMPSATYVETYVPAGWQRDPARPETLSRPEGVEELYKRVVEPHCVACHSLQGHNAGETLAAAGTQPLANAINFSSWERFISYREIIIDYVFHRGVMPLSLRNFEKFWQNPQDKPALLAAFLQDPTLFDAHGNVLQPGRPIARPGPDRTIKTPFALDGSASSFARTYQWAIVGSPVGVTLKNNKIAPAGSTASVATPIFDAASDGVYEISLTVSNAQGNSAAKILRLTVNNAATSVPTFVDDVMPILGSASGTNCGVCHDPAGGYDGIPVSYRSSNPTLYRDVLDRVNLADPEMSLLLRKPTGPRHGGGEQIGLVDLNSVSGRANYNTLLNWIRAGAPCGVDAVVCQ